MEKCAIRAEYGKSTQSWGSVFENCGSAELL